MDKWKKGDAVAVVEHPDALLRLSVVERVTPSGLISVAGWRGLFRSDGWERGSEGLWARRIVVPTDAHREAAKRSDLWRRVESLVGNREIQSRVPTADLQRFADLLSGEAKS